MVWTHASIIIENGQLSHIAPFEFDCDKGLDRFYIIQITLISLVKN